MSAWHSVKHRLPKEWDKVLIFYVEWDNDGDVASYSYGSGYWDGECWRDEFLHPINAFEVTHFCQPTPDALLLNVRIRKYVDMLTKTTFVEAV